MLSTILRKSCSGSSSVVLKRRSVAVFNAIDSLLHSPSPVGSYGRSAAGVTGSGGGPKCFSVAKSGPFDFRASYASQAGFAAESTSVDDDGLDIAGLGMDKSIVSALASRGIHKLFPIQRAVLEPAMQGRDMIGRARTGTGKTLAFGMPILDKIIQFNAKHGRGKNPLALVMAPTRELANQVEKEFRLTAPNLATICCYGGSPIGNQIRSLSYGVNVVVGTPGRLIDLLKRGALNLSEVQFVVLDEADQMLAVGFEEAVESILQQLPQKRQSMMFSATMPPPIRELTRKYLKDPLIIDLVGEDDQKLAEGISLYSIASDNYAKASILGPLITEHAKGGKCIIFTQTKRDADSLSYAMAGKYKCAALHGDIMQNQRERTLAGFREGHFNILIATDVAARGLDIPNVDLVIHYELPNTSEIFVHRSGRTGRAGKKGSAILIYSDQQARDVRIIEQDIGSRFTQLPRIEVRSEDMLDVGGGGGGFRSGSFGGGQRDLRFGDDFGRGQRSSDFGRSSGGFGRSTGFGGSGSGQSGGRFGSFGDFGSKGGSGGGFGDFGSERGSGGGFGDFGSKGSGGGFGDLGSKGGSGGSFGDFGSKGGSGGSFGDFGSKRGSGGGFGDFGSKGSGGGFEDFGSKGGSGGSFGDYGSKGGSGGSFGDFGPKRGSGGGFGDLCSKGLGGGFGDFGPEDNTKESNRYL